MKITKSNPLQSLVNTYLIDSPLPSNISHFWSFGSLQGLNQVILIISGVSLAMHYTPNTGQAFSSVEHIMRDVNNGWFLRYLHANGASFFFIFVYLHIGRGLYYGSYRSPRTLLWSIGVIIYILMMAKELAEMYILNDMFLYSSYLAFIEPKTKSSNRIGPHNKDIISIFTGCLLGDAHMTKNKNSYHIRFEQIPTSYIFWLSKQIKNLGYSCSLPQKEGNTYHFYTYNFDSLDFLYNQFYMDNVKKLPDIAFLDTFFTRQAFSIWMRGDFNKPNTGYSITLPNSFTLDEANILCDFQYSKYEILCLVDMTYTPHLISISRHSLLQQGALLSPYISKMR